MAGKNGWSTWSMQTKLTVSVGLFLAVVLVAGMNIFT
jgi:hypothetical protein